MRKLDPRLRHWAKKVLHVRIPGNAFHRLLAGEHSLRNIVRNELTRFVYYQPMFEAMCRSVGEGFHLQLCPDSKMPYTYNVEIEIGAFTRLSARTTFQGAAANPLTPRVRIGAHTYIGDRCVFRAGTEIVIGDHVHLAANVLLAGDPGHPMDPLDRRTLPAPLSALGRIDVEDDVWLASNVAVIGNVRIGEGAVVAAYSVVTRDVPAHAVVAGNPARVVRMLPGARIEQRPTVVEMPGAGRNELTRGSALPP